MTQSIVSDTELYRMAENSSNPLTLQAAGLLETGEPEIKVIETGHIDNERIAREVARLGNLGIFGTF